MAGVVFGTTGAFVTLFFLPVDCPKNKHRRKNEEKYISQMHFQHICNMYDLNTDIRNDIKKYETNK